MTRFSDDVKNKKANFGRGKRSRYTSLCIMLSCFQSECVKKAPTELPTRYFFHRNGKKKMKTEGTILEDIDRQKKSSVLEGNVILT